MPKKHAELILYLGLTDSYCLREGPFNFKSKDKEEIIRCGNAVQYARNFLTDPIYGDGRIVKRLVDNEKDAVALIDYYEKNISSSEGLISIHYCMHGNIAFFRKIKFAEFTEGRESELIKKLQGSGYKPIPLHRWTGVNQEDDSWIWKENIEYLGDIDSIRLHD